MQKRPAYEQNSSECANATGINGERKLFSKVAAGMEGLALVVFLDHPST
jgi:hypothetical protein